MVTYSGTKSSYIAGYYVERSKKRILQPNNWVDYLSGFAGPFGFPMVSHHIYISNPDDVKSQREDIRKIISELEEGGFLSTQHDEDVAEMNRDDEKVLLKRRESTEFYRIKPTSGFIAMPFIGVLEHFLHLFRGLNGVEYVKSELAYQIYVGDSFNKELLGRGLATLLNEKYGFKGRE